MERIVHELKQGTPQWHAFRLQHHGASEAAAMLGLSKKVTRTELLNAKKTGLPREFSDWVQEHILDPGHEVERLARPLADEFAGVEFFPQIISLGKLSASTDGLDFLDVKAWECKRLNRENGPIVQAGNVPEEHMPQCQQVLMVTGADRLLFTVSDGTRENTFHTWVEPDTAWFDRIRAGWAQFDVDLESHEPTTPAEKVVAEPVEALPAPTVKVSGELALTDNFKVFEERLREFLANRLIREPKTDEDFVNLDAQIKAMKAGREALKSAKAQMLAQVQPIDQASKTADMLDTLLQQNCAMAESLLKNEKERRKGEIVATGVSALQAHVAGLNTRLGKPYMPKELAIADFAGAIKGMRVLASMEDAVGTLLANSKIKANEVADRLDVNLKWLREHAAAHAFLFADAAQLVLKDNEAFAAIAQQRIDAHEAAEKAKAEARAEAEREKIRQQEAEKLRREQEERDRAEAQRKREEETAAARAQQEQAAQQQPAPAATEPVHQVAQPAPAPAPAANVVAMPTRAPAAPATPPSLKLGTIAERLGFPLSADFLKTLGFEPAAKVGAHGVYHEAQFGRICAALVDHVQAVQAKQAA